MANTFYRVLENIYRSIYGQHRFYENVLGIDVQLYRIDRDSYSIYRETFGRGVSIPTAYSPIKTTRIVISLHTLSKFTEDTSDIGSVTFYTYDKDIEKGDLLKTTYNNKEIAIYVKEKKKIGFFTDIIYELEGAPDAARTLPRPNNI